MNQRALAESQPLYTLNLEHKPEVQEIMQIVGFQGFVAWYILVQDTNVALLTFAIRAPCEDEKC